MHQLTVSNAFFDRLQNAAIRAGFQKLEEYLEALDLSEESPPIPEWMIKEVEETVAAADRGEIAYIPGDIAFLEIRQMMAELSNSVQKK